MNEETVNKILAIVENAFGNLSFEYNNIKEEFIAEIKTEVEKLNKQ
jgi:archaellum component FlaC